MKARCKNEKNPEYFNYGGRGIRVCDRWTQVGGFQNFIQDMNMRPSPKHSIDRINVDGNYEPSNCRWTTADVQAYNKRLLKQNKSGYTGVFWLKNNKKWLAYFTHNHKRVNIGCFTDKLMAVKARSDYIMSKTNMEIRT
jgi:hypothetical protein